MGNLKFFTFLDHMNLSTLLLWTLAILEDLFFILKMLGNISDSCLTKSFCFGQYIKFYFTKALLMVKYMKMLGNSTQVFSLIKNFFSTEYVYSLLLLMAFLYGITTKYHYSSLLKSSKNAT